MDLTGCGRIALASPCEQALRALMQVRVIQITSGSPLIEDHDQGHLYTNLEVQRLTCPGRGSNPGLPRGKRAL
jgi:hypothetical protein